MGNTCSCIRHSKDDSPALRASPVECGDETAPCGSGGEHASSSADAVERCASRESLEQVTRSGKSKSDVEDRIERSKEHWSRLTEYESDLDDEEVAQENRQVFEELQSHSTWGFFFKTFGYDTKLRERSGELEVGEKFAEGGQAELFHVKVTWRNSMKNERDLEKGREWVLKVFKKGTRLRKLQAQWPLGYLQWRAKSKVRYKQGLFLPRRYRSDVYRGTLLQDGRFAFLIEKEDEDLRSRIDRAMLNIANDHGPFSKAEVEWIMLIVAHGMDWLHKRNILHRDLKAANVLVTTVDGYIPNYFVADYECSIGVVGTGFFMAPEILQALKDKVPSKDVKVFSKASDVYSYGMMCYEVLTGKLPFEGHRKNDYDLVLSGQRPKIPEYVDKWINELLKRCWDVDCSKRPLFPEILRILSNNSAYGRSFQIFFEKDDQKRYLKNEVRLLQEGLVIEPK